ncbi:hypothetical protein TNCV_822671 [Trichonephila clavipes]|nr:hypothetical protein TNCV_822671 [Trichonephila clavipes]
MVRLETPPLELSYYRGSQHLKKDIRPGKFRVRVQIIIGKDEIWRSPDDRRNRNWRDAEVLDRQNDRSTYGNRPQRDHGFENRSRIDRDNHGFESRYQFRDRVRISHKALGVVSRENDEVSKGKRRLSENQGGRREQNINKRKRSRVENPKSRFSKGEQALITDVPEIKSPKKLVLDLQKERCKSKGNQSGPEENYLGCQAHTTRVANSRSRVRGMEDPVITL